MYNSISMDMVDGPVAKVEKIEDQMELFVDYARNFGVPQVRGRDSKEQTNITVSIDPCRSFSLIPSRI